MSPRRMFSAFPLKLQGIFSLRQNGELSEFLPIATMLKLYSSRSAYQSIAAMNPLKNDLMSVAQAHDTESLLSCATEERDSDKLPSPELCATTSRGCKRRSAGDEEANQPPAKKLQAETTTIDDEIPELEKRFQVRTISLRSPKSSDDLSPQEKLHKQQHAACIADILDQATRVALEIGSLYKTPAAASSSTTTATTTPATTTAGFNAHRRRYQRRNSFVDRRRFLAPTIVVPDGLLDNSNDTPESRTVDTLPLPPLSMPLRHSFTAGCNRQGSSSLTTALSAIEADFQRRRRRRRRTSLQAEEDVVSKV
jgi:hypothetical protein